MRPTHCPLRARPGSPHAFSHAGHPQGLLGCPSSRAQPKGTGSGSGGVQDGSGSVQLPREEPKGVPSSGEQTRGRERSEVQEWLKKSHGEGTAQPANNFIKYVCVGGSEIRRHGLTLSAAGSGCLCVSAVLSTFLCTRKHSASQGEGKYRGPRRQGGNESPGFHSLRSGSQGKSGCGTPATFPMHEASQSPEFPTFCTCWIHGSASKSLPACGPSSLLPSGSPAQLLESRSPTTSCQLTAMPRGPREKRRLRSPEGASARQRHTLPGIVMSTV